MTLPAPGNPINFDQIRIELGVPSQTLFNLDSASLDAYAILQHCSTYPNSTNPDAIDEWYNYNHNDTASVFISADFGTSCNDACTSTPFIPCLINAYVYSSTYYADPQCRSGVSGYFVTPTNCSGGTKLGQTCYYFSNGTLVSTEQCTTTTTTTTTACPAYGTFLYCSGTDGVFADGSCGEIVCSDFDGCGGSQGPCV